MGAPKGTTPSRAGLGRPPGSPNKFTASIKDAFKAAFEQRGGVQALVDWAETNPDEFYRLASKLIPSELQANITGNLTLAQLVMTPDKPDV